MNPAHRATCVSVCHGIIGDCNLLQLINGLLTCDKNKYNMWYCCLLLLFVIVVINGLLSVFFFKNKKFRIKIIQQYCRLLYHSIWSGHLSRHPKIYTHLNPSYTNAHIMLIGSQAKIHRWLTPECEWIQLVNEYNLAFSFKSGKNTVAVPEMSNSDEIPQFLNNRATVISMTCYCNRPYSWVSRSITYNPQFIRRLRPFRSLKSWQSHQILCMIHGWTMIRFKVLLSVGLLKKTTL